MSDPPEMKFRGRERRKEPSEPKRKNYFPYALLVALIALIAIPASLGLLSNRGLVIVGESETTLRSTTISAEPPCKEFSKPSDIANLFSVDTSSLMGGYSLDARAKLLKFCVHGPDGSTGTFRIVIPKYVLGDQLRVTLDNLPADAKIEDFGSYHVVSLKYHHSERIITITGEAALPKPPSNGTQTGAGQQQQQQQVVVVPGGQLPAIITPQEPKKPDKVDPCPPERLTPESIVAAGIPVVFSSDEKPSFTVKPDASGIRLQTKTRALVNFMSDMGESVGVAFKLDNLSKEDILVRIKVTASDALFVDLVKSTDIDVVRPINADEYLVKLSGSASKAELITTVTAVSPGFHVFFIEILPLFDQPLCP
jgi:hypothetical protein